MKRLLTNILLFITAIVLLCTIGVLGMFVTLYSSIRYLNKSDSIKYWGDVFFELAIGLDRIGNVLLGSFLNNTAIKSTEMPFGKVEHTISLVLAINYSANNLTIFGKKIVSILEFVHKGHITKFKHGRSN